MLWLRRPQQHRSSGCNLRHGSVFKVPLEALPDVRRRASMWTRERTRSVSLVRHHGMTSLNRAKERMQVWGACLREELERSIWEVSLYRAFGRAFTGIRRDKWATNARYCRPSSPLSLGPWRLEEREKRPGGMPRRQSACICGTEPCVWRWAGRRYVSRGIRHDGVPEKLGVCMRGGTMNMEAIGKD